MLQSEIDEISEAFSDAWDEYFGANIAYVPFDRTATEFDDLYGESKNLQYDFNRAIIVNGTLKEVQEKDTIRPYGKRAINNYEMTIVTKELLDGGILEVNTNDLILYKSLLDMENPRIRKFRIVDTFQKVQFKDTKVFTKVIVVEDNMDIRITDFPQELMDKWQ